MSPRLAWAARNAELMAPTDVPVKIWKGAGSSGPRPKTSTMPATTPTS